MTTEKAMRIHRMLNANKLICLIATHGRCFFCDGKGGEISLFEMNSKTGKIQFRNAWSGKVIYIYENGVARGFAGFHHGGTLRDLVRMMRDYILSGKKLSIAWIAPKHWGYGVASDELISKCRDLEIISNDPQV